jgi:hypothetical protein
VHRQNSGLTLQVFGLKVDNKLLLQKKFCNIESDCCMLNHGSLFPEAAALQDFLQVKDIRKPGFRNFQENDTASSSH